MVVPISGPLSENPNVINAEFTYNGSGHGDLTVVLPDGEVCKGKYTTIPEGTITSESRFFFSPYVYANYFGNAYLIENKQYGQGLLIGNRGTIMQLEYFTSSRNPTHGYGIATDNNGNIYKILF